MHIFLAQNSDQLHEIMSGLQILKIDGQTLQSSNENDVDVEEFLFLKHHQIIDNFLILLMIQDYLILVTLKLG